MHATTATHCRNFAVFAGSAMLLLLGLPSLKSHVQDTAVDISMAGLLLVMAKAFLKFLPLMLALLVELSLAPEKRLFCARLFKWQKSRRIDLYSFILSHMHRVHAILNMAFTFGIPILLDRLIKNSMPRNFSLFALLERHAGYALAVLAFVFVATFFNYWEHRLWHSRILWPIHRFHHSATDYNALTETRKHFTETLLTPLFFTLPLSLLGAPLEFVATYLALILFQGFMNHTDQGISYGWIGRHLWIDPLYHKLHHSSAAEHMNMNFSGTLPLWDRLFGTYAPAHGELAVGVSGAPHYDTLPYWKIHLRDFSDLLINLGTALKDKLGRRGSIGRGGN
ncbi:sterol desaturase family protein [Noviherbaspirillum sedimenti]|nr:sterol desaturase family protein [Noviherbaspirillum sedimenti]